MPMYVQVCPSCGFEDQMFRSMAEAHLKPSCPRCGQEMDRDYQAEGAGPHLDEAFTHPIEMHSIAVTNDEDIKAFKRRNPDVEIGTNPNRDDYGVPIARSRAEKLRILRAEGFEEKN